MNNVHFIAQYTSRVHFWKNILKYLISREKPITRLEILYFIQRYYYYKQAIKLVCEV